MNDAANIHAAMMTQNELTDLVENVTSLLTVCDTVTVVDGGSTDLTIPYMRNWSKSEPKLRFFIHPFKDNFSAQRNNYLARVAEVAIPGDWVVSLDPDEVLDAATLAILRELLAGMGGEVACVMPRCRSVSYRGPNRVWQNEDQYWKPLIYRWHDGLRYAETGGPVHERLDGLRGSEIQTGQHAVPELVYEHRKQENVIWPRGVRNYFCGGGGPNLGSKNHRWVELRALTDSLGIRDWHTMQRYLVHGNIDQRLKDWIIRYRLEDGWDGSSEQREFYKTYFWLYHPEEEPEELRGEHIP